MLPELKKTIQKTGTVVCRECGGQGLVPAPELPVTQHDVCQECGGVGVVVTQAGHAVCRKCRGEGHVAVPPMRSCLCCSGEGNVKLHVVQSVYMSDCGRCHGSGRYGGECYECNGTGKVLSQTVKVDVSPSPMGCFPEWLSVAVAQMKSERVVVEKKA